MEAVMALGIMVEVGRAEETQVRAAAEEEGVGWAEVAMEMVAMVAVGTETGEMAVEAAGLVAEVTAEEAKVGVASEAEAREMAPAEEVMVMAVVAEPEGHHLAAQGSARVKEGSAEVATGAVAQVVEAGEAAAAVTAATEMEVSAWVAVAWGVEEAEEVAMVAVAWVEVGTVVEAVEVMVTGVASGVTAGAA